MSTTNTTLASRKVCFVTIGATASFDSLIRATLSSTFLEVLKQYAYTNLCIQHGKDGRTILQELVEQYSKKTIPHTISISGFDFNMQGLGAEMRAAKGQNHSDEGVVISHAGTRLLSPCSLSSLSHLAKVPARYSPLSESPSH